MTNSVNDNMIDARSEPLEVSGRLPFIDIHCHCLAGLDDGPATMSDSVALCRKMVEDGIAVAVATPHLFGGFKDYNEAAKVREAVRLLNETLKNDGVRLKVLAGSEVHVDERLWRFIKEGRIMTLADGGRYILLELPFQVSVEIAPLLTELASAGVQCVISHVERIAPFAAPRKILLAWIDRGAHLQITASSLMGGFGRRVQSLAWSFLESGWAKLVATDSHDLDHRRPRMRAAFDRVAARLGKDVAHMVCIENPSRVVSGQDILPVSLHDQQGAQR
jgi:protein-tyrosine phosphatase